MEDFDFAFYNKHYLKAREDGAIMDAFSDGPFHGKNADGYICFNDKAGYQLRLIIDGVPTEENPPIFEGHGIPLYKWDGAQVLRRSGAEIQADIDRIPPPPPSPMEQLRADVDYISIMAGVEL